MACFGCSRHHFDAVAGHVFGIQLTISLEAANPSFFCLQGSHRHNTQRAGASVLGDQQLPDRLCELSLLFRLQCSLA